MSVFHGGNLAGAAEKFGQPEAGWVDLSTGINPHGYPIPQLDTDLWGRLPDQHLMEELKNAAAFYYKVSSPEYVIPVSGTQTLLQILPHLFEAPKQVRIVAPTYKEHEFCWQLAGHDVQEKPDLYSAAEDADILIVVSPNNPTGEAYAPDVFLELAQKQHEKGGLLIVDGAFLDCTPTLELSQHVGANGLVVLRSFGKFFGLAGLRLGFVLASGELGQRLKDGIGPWSVNGPAMEIGRRAFQDINWIKQTRHDLQETAKRLDDVLERGGLQVVGGTSLFRYCAHDQAQVMYEELANKGILVRPFPEMPNRLRVGLPASEVDWQRLEQALTLIQL